jgi:glycerophosphoryl diester phosphodiesterase
MYKSFIEEAKKIKKDETLNRIIPQIYGTIQFEPLIKIFPFSKVILTLYASREKESVLQKFVKETPEIYGISVDKNDFSKRNKLVKSVQNMEKKVFVHTIDSLEQLKYFQKQGMSGIYTNHIREFKQQWGDLSTAEKVDK